jgi:hypothetical protein
MDGSTINYLSSQLWMLSAIQHYYDFMHDPVRGMITVSMEPPVGYSGESLIVDIVLELTVWPPVVLEMYLIRYSHPEDMIEERPISTSAWHPKGVQFYSAGELINLLSGFGL